MALFWVAVILLVVWAIRGTERPPSTSHRTALHNLEERFARGEIGPDEFEARRSALAR
jgi:putative membrane protein